MTDVRRLNAIALLVASSSATTTLISVHSLLLVPALDVGFLSNPAPCTKLAVYSLNNLGAMLLSWGLVARHTLAPALFWRRLRCLACWNSQAHSHFGGHMLSGRITVRRFVDLMARVVSVQSNQSRHAPAPAEAG